MQKWRIEGKQPIRISVNVSRESLKYKKYMNACKKILERYGVDPSFVEFEITESVMFENFEGLSQTINDIHAMGCTCSIDDFGTGYSSLNLLKNIKVDAIKLDRDFFISHCTEDEQERSKSVLLGVISIAKRLNMQVVAEGVEDPDQIEFLRVCGCDLIQSFAFYKPLSDVDFLKLF